MALSWILPFLVCTAVCAQHANAVSVVFSVGAAEIFCFPSYAAVVVLALDTGSNVSSGQAVNWMESKLELLQPRCHRCGHVRSRKSLQWLGLRAFPESRGLDAAQSASTPCCFSQKLLSPHRPIAAAPLVILAVQAGSNVSSGRAGKRRQGGVDRAEGFSRQVAAFGVEQFLRKNVGKFHHQKKKRGPDRSWKMQNMCVGSFAALTCASRQAYSAGKSGELDIVVSVVFSS